MLCVSITSITCPAIRIDTILAPFSDRSLSPAISDRHHSQCTGLLALSDPPAVLNMKPCMYCLLKMEPTRAAEAMLVLTGGNWTRRASYVTVINVNCVSTCHPRGERA